MHFEILVEDESGKRLLTTLVSLIIGANHTCTVHGYRGIGRIPRGLRATTDPSQRVFLDNLPRLLRGYGSTFASYPSDYRAAVIVVCDLDRRCLNAFRQELLAVLASVNPAPTTRFCIAVEEGEAWLLGDLPAVLSAYPRARQTLLSAYVNDSICGTWERLADAVYPGGAASLAGKPYYEIGMEKIRWAEDISRQMEVDRNASPSFCHFRDKLRELAAH